MTRHASLDEAHWARFTLDQQILMIGNEMELYIGTARTQRPSCRLPGAAPASARCGEADPVFGGL